MLLHYTFLNGGYVHNKLYYAYLFMKRQEAREQAFLLVFENSFKNDTLEEIINSANLARDIEICDYAIDVFNGVKENSLTIDKYIEENAVGWKKDRISKVALAVLRVSVYEMLYKDDIPVAVSINEAVNLAKKYSIKDEASFINGVLGSISKKIEGKNV